MSAPDMLAPPRDRSSSGGPDMPRPQARRTAGRRRLGARTPGAPRRSLILLLAMLLACSPLSLLIDGAAWLTLTATAAIVVIGVGAALRALVRFPALVALGQVLAVIVLVGCTEVVTRALEPARLLAPSETIGAQIAVIADGIAQLGGSHPPVDLAAPGVVVLMLLLALVALALDLLFVDLGQATLAALGLVAFALSPALMFPDGGPWWTIAGPVAGALLVLGARALGSLRTGAVVVVTCVIVLVVGPTVAGVLPQRVPAPYPLTIEALNRWAGRDGSVSPVMIDDSVSVRRELMRAQETQLLRYTTDDPEPGYLRLHTLSLYHDGIWGRADITQQEASFSDRRSADEPLDGVPRYDITVDALDTDALPAPQSIRWADTGDLPLRGVTDSLGELRLEGGLASLRDYSYAVQSEARPFGEDDLRGVTDDQIGRPDDHGIAVFGLPSAIVTLAEQVRHDAGAVGAYETARAVETYFRTTYDYDLEARTPDGADPLTSFLEDKRGYCEQFAATFALMMDALGYPTRVAIGFTAGTTDGDARVVTNHNAHAWPEVWFGPDYGWVRFEPTPAAADTGISLPDYAQPGDEPADDASPDVAELPPGAASTAPEVPTEAPTTTAAAAADSGVGPREVIQGVLLALAAVGLVALAVWLGLRRRAAVLRERRWSEALAAEDPTRAAALLAWDEIDALAGGSGAKGGGRGRREGGAAGDARSADGARSGAETGAGPAAALGRAIARARGSLGRRSSVVRLNPALPPREALVDLVDQVRHRGIAVTQDDKAHARRLADAVTWARYAPPGAPAPDLGTDEDGGLGVAEAGDRGARMAAPSSESVRPAASREGARLAAANDAKVQLAAANDEKVQSTAPRDVDARSARSDEVLLSTARDDDARSSASSEDMRSARAHEVARPSPPSSDGAPAAAVPDSETRPPQTSARHQAATVRTDADHLEAMMRRRPPRRRF